MLITLGPGAPALVAYVNLVHGYNPLTVVVDTPYELVYYNNFRV